MYQHCGTHLSQFTLQAGKTRQLSEILCLQTYTAIETGLQVGIAYLRDKSRNEELCLAIQLNRSFMEDEGETRGGIQYFHVALEMLQGTSGREDHGHILSCDGPGWVKGTSARWLSTHQGDKAVTWPMEADGESGLCLKHNNDIAWEHTLDEAYKVVFQCILTRILFLMICGKYLGKIWLISNTSKRLKQRLSKDQGLCFLLHYCQHFVCSVFCFSPSSRNANSH